MRGRTVLVTGAARGIGEGVARAAAARGARVALVGLEPERLARVTAELNAAGPGGHLWHEADVTAQANLDEAVRRTVEVTGRLDIVVANAGIAPLGTVAVAPVDALVRTVEVNLGGVIRTVSAALPHVRAARGYFLLVSSAAAFTAMPGMAAYCAAKAGVEHFGNALRLELAPYGVAVGTAHPIWIDTDLVRDIHDDLPTFRAMLKRLPGPLGKVISVRDCAEAMMRGIERRQRRLYIPRSVGLIQALRTVTNSRFAGALTLRAGRGQVGQMDAEVQALGRSFGANSVGHRPGHR